MARTSGTAIGSAVGTVLGAVGGTVGAAAGAALGASAGCGLTDLMSDTSSKEQAEIYDQVRANAVQGNTPRLRVGEGRAVRTIKKYHVSC